MSDGDFLKERKGFYKSYRKNLRISKQKTSEEIIEISLNRAKLLMDTTPPATKEYYYHSGEVVALTQALQQIKEYRENGLLL